jgi:hypothetical protein
MTRSTYLITIEVTVQDSITAFEEEIETTLQVYGHPVSWIVTDVNINEQTATIDAIVIEWDTAR